MADSGRLNLPPVLRAGVVGAGVFGSYHAAKYAAIPGVRLAAVAELNQATGEPLAERFGAEWLEGFEQLVGKVDIATIATPATTHYEIARTLIDAGIHVLVEKPLALTLKDADDLIARARAKGVRIQVGHQERFVVAAMGLLARSAPPKHIQCRRAGPFTGRCTDVSVVLDLMIHDLDLVHQLVDAPLASVRASARRAKSRHIDAMVAHLTFANGTKADVFSSRLSDKRERSMVLEYDDGAVEIDFIARTFTNTTPADIRPLEAGDDMARRIAADPLGFAVGEFVRAVREEAEPFVSGFGARKALATALRLHEVAGALQAA